MKKYTKDESLQLINETIRQIEIDFPANNTYANSYIVKSITEQLQYIKEALDNKNDRSRLKNLTLGLLAARELEPDYENLTDKIYIVCEIARQMQKHKSNGEPWI